MAEDHREKTRIPQSAPRRPRASTVTQHRYQNQLSPASDRKRYKNFQPALRSPAPWPLPHLKLPGSKHADADTSPRRWISSMTERGAHAKPSKLAAQSQPQQGQVSTSTGRHGPGESHSHSSLATPEKPGPEEDNQRVRRIPASYSSRECGLSRPRSSGQDEAGCDHVKPAPGMARQAVTIRKVPR